MFSGSTEFSLVGGVMVLTLQWLGVLTLPVRRDGGRTRSGSLEVLAAEID
jgi:hypothetical protein